MQARLSRKEQKSRVPGRRSPIMQIKFIWIGKTKNPSIRILASNYLERISHMISCEVIEVRDLSKRKHLRGNNLVMAEGEELAKHLPAQGRLVALDETGRQFTSDDFARWLESQQNSGVRVISFLIGGPEGLSRMIHSRAHTILSMGKMTWTHEMCRVLLLEQVYRALCILRNIPYHRGGD
jgi:23S rRNA (pseudouridine1915-N3)-methyltransferase